MPAVPTAAVSPRSRSAMDARIVLSAKDILADDRIGRGAQPLQVQGVGVRLAEPGQTLVGVQLDDRPQRERLMHADGVEQRRIGEGNRRDARAGDPDPLTGHQCTRSVGEHRPPGREDPAQLGDIVRTGIDQRGTHRAARGSPPGSPCFHQ